MSKAVFVKEKGRYKCFFRGIQVKFLYKLINNIYNKYLYKCFVFTKKCFSFFDWKPIFVDLGTFVLNAFIEGVAINFITVVLFKDSFSLFRVVAYGLIPKMLEYYYFKFNKNGRNNKVSKEKSSTE